MNPTMNQHPEYCQVVPADDDMLSLTDIVDIFSRGKRWIAGTTVIFVVAALTYLLVAKPVYRSSALIRIELGQSALMLDLLGKGEFANVIPELSAVVEEMRSYDFVRNLIPLNTTKDEVAPTINAQDMAEFNDRIAIFEKGVGSGLVEIAVTGEDPDANSLVLLNMIDLYNNRLEQRLTEYINDSIVILTDKLETTRKEIELSKSLAGPNTDIAHLSNLERTFTDVSYKIDFLNQAAELAADGLVIVSQPVSENDPVRPRYTMVMVLATMLGVMAGVVLVLLREMARKGLRTEQEVERKTGMHVLASIATDDVEGLRVLRTNVLHLLSQSENNRLMVCGPRHGVGRCYIAVHLARVISEGGKKVLLVDADLRQGVLSTVFADARGGVSLAACLQQDVEFSPVVVSDSLHLLAGCDYPDMPSELLMGQKFEQLLGQVSKYYDVVLICVPPVLTATDAALVGGRCANTLMVIRGEQTTLKDILAADRRLQQGGVAGICAVLNGVSD